MAEDLNEIPCTGRPIEPERLIPQKDYEECDTCAQTTEQAQGDVLSDDQIKSIQDEFTAITDQIADEDQAYVNSIAECVSKLNDKMAALNDEKNAMVSAAIIRGKLDELLDNLEPVRYYFQRVLDYIASGQGGGSSEMTLLTLDSKAKQYATSIDVSGQFTLTNFKVKYRYAGDIINSTEVNLAQQVSNGFGIVTITDESKDTTFNGALYDNYYNKLNDPLNNFFSAEERGLSTNVADADAELKNAAAIGGTPVDQIATTMQGSQSFIIKDNAKFNAFFAGFEQKYNTRVSEIRQAQVDPALNELKQKLDIVARDAAAQNGNGAYWQSQLDQYNWIKSERDRLKAKEESFMSKIAVDATNPMGSAFVRDLAENMKCLGDIDQEDDPQPDPEPYTGSLKDTFSIVTADSPNITKRCYWKRFAQLANVVGLMPFPDIMPKSPGQGLRYWPVGLLIPTPAMLVKIPLPIVWMPLLVISSKFGVIVIFLGINGVMPCPYIFYASKTGVKKFVVTLRGPSQEFGYEPTELDFGYPVKCRVPWLTQFPNMSDLMMGLMVDFRLGTIGTESFDEFMYAIKKDITDSIDKIELPSLNAINALKSKLKPIMDGLEIIGNLDAYKDEIYAAIKKDTLDWIDTIQMPKITLPKDTGRQMQLPAQIRTILQMIAFYSKKFAIPTLQMFDMKNKIMPYVMELMNDPAVIAEINKMKDELAKITSHLPIELDLKIEEHWERFKAFLNEMIGKLYKIFAPNPWDATVSYNAGQRVSHGGKTYFSNRSDNLGDAPKKMSDTWIEMDDLLKSKLMLPEISFSNPFKCKEVLAIPAIDLAFLSVIALAFAAIREAVDLLVATGAIAILGFSVFTPDSILIAIYAILDKIIPSLPLPNLMFFMDYYLAFLKMIKDFGAIDLPKIPLSALLPPITIDFGVVKPPMKNIIGGQMDALIALLPLDILRIDTLGFMALDATMLKETVKNVITGAIDQVARPIKPAYDAVMLTAAIARIAGQGLEKSPLDAALAPLDVAKTIAVAQAKAIVLNILSSIDLIWVVPEKLIALALALIEKFVPLPFPAVAAAAAFGAGRAFRILHPILYDDDLPPWERLWLGNPVKSLNNNFLLVLFLDEFCHVAKQHGGFFENYLP